MGMPVSAPNPLNRFPQLVPADANANGVRPWAHASDDLAHVTALRVFSDERVALVSQIPMLLLTVGYTILSLWILAQANFGLG